MTSARAVRRALGAAGVLVALGLCSASGCALVVGADFDDKTLFICDPCYTGPPQTELRGACVGGCLDESGACVGEVTPRMEDCATDEVDDNCDGTRECDGGPLFARSFGDGGNQLYPRVAVDAGSNVVVAVQADGYVDYGGGAVGDVVGPHVHVVKLDQDGGHQWSRSFLGDVAQYIGGMAVDGNGNVVVAGHFLGTIDVGGGPLGNPGDLDIFVTKMGADGAFQWGFSAGDAVVQAVTTIAVDQDGNIIVGGHTNGSLQLDATHGITSQGGYDIFIAKLDPNGTPIWMQRYGDGADQSVVDAAVGPSGEIAIAGYFKGVIDFGGGPFTDADGLNDGFVAVLEPTAGGHVWSHQIAGCCDTAGLGVAFDSAGRLYVSGQFHETADLAGETLTAAGGFDAFLAAYDPGGQLLWGKGFGDGADQLGLDVAVDAAGMVLLGGQAAGAIDFGDGPVPTAGDADAFVAKFDSNGGVIWGRVFGAPGTQVARGLGPLPTTGEIFVAGDFDSGFDLGDLRVDTAGANDLWIAKLRP